MGIAIFMTVHFGGDVGGVSGYKKGIRVARDPNKKLNNPLCYIQHDTHRRATSRPHRRTQQTLL